MNTKSIYRVSLFTCALIYATSTHAFWGAVLDVITKSITDAASGQATRVEQLAQIRKLNDQINTAKDQLAYQIQHSKRYSGDNAWRASVLIRQLDRHLKEINANGRHITADAHNAASRLLAVLPTDEDFNAARTAAERTAYEIQQDVAARNALRDSLLATMNSSKAFHQQMADSATNLDAINRDLSQTDSQLAALQLIGAATTQNSQQLQTLTKSVVAQTDLLMNVYAKELAAQDRLRGDGAKAARTKIVPSHLVEEYRRRGIDVKPASIDGVLTGSSR